MTKNPNPGFFIFPFLVRRGGGQGRAGQREVLASEGLIIGFNGPLRQYFSLYRAVSQREGERGERTDESKNIQTTPTRTYGKHIRALALLSSKL